MLFQTTDEIAMTIVCQNLIFLLFTLYLGSGCFQNDEKPLGRSWGSAVISSIYTCTTVTCIGVGQGVSHLYLYVSTFYFGDVSNIVIMAGEK